MNIVFEDDLPWLCARCDKPFTVGEEVFEEMPGWVCEDCHIEIGGKNMVFPDYRERPA